MTESTIAGMPPAKIEIRNLNIYYGDFRAVKDITLNIPEGCVTAFIGPSGCGKSTLLRSLNRMYDLYEGQRAEGFCRMGDTDILSKETDVTELRSRIGMVFQRPTPFPMSIFDNIAYGVRLRRNVKSASSGLCRRPPSGTTSRTNSISPARVFRAVSSSVCASRAASP